METDVLPENASLEDWPNCQDPVKKYRKHVCAVHGCPWPAGQRRLRVSSAVGRSCATTRVANAKRVPVVPRKRLARAFAGAVWVHDGSGDSSFLGGRVECERRASFGPLRRMQKKDALKNQPAFFSGAEAVPHARPRSSGTQPLAAARPTTRLSTPQPTQAWAPALQLLENPRRLLHRCEPRRCGRTDHAGCGTPLSVSTFLSARITGKISWLPSAP